MAISRNILSRDLAGKTLKTAMPLRMDAGVSVPAGSSLLVADVAGGFALSSPEPCPCCGVSVRLERVPRTATFLADDPGAPDLESLAFWQSRAYENDHLWAECSNCGFRIENYKAAVQGRSSDDYVRVGTYRFCPGCGKRMAVRNHAGRAVL